MSNKVFRLSLSLLLAFSTGFLFWNYKSIKNRASQIFAHTSNVALQQEAVNVDTKLPPTQITFPKLNKSIVVSASIIDNGVWGLSDDKASWLATSAVPGEGNVIIYAHNRPGLFGNLGALQIGDEIILTQNNKLITYKVRKTLAIKPNQVEAILSPNNQLTLYTCDGTFDQKRLVVYADPV